MTHGRDTRLMASKSSGSLIGLLVILAPIAWVCSLCTTDDRSAPPEPKPAPGVESPRPTPTITTPPLSTDPIATDTPQPDHPSHRKRRHRRKTAASPKEPSGTATVDIAQELDAALEDARREPTKTPPSTRARRAEGRSTEPDSRRPGVCCKVCSARSKPCGDSCISRSKTCHKGPGCAC